MLFLINKLLEYQNKNSKQLTHFKNKPTQNSDIKSTVLLCFLIATVFYCIFFYNFNYLKLSLVILEDSFFKNLRYYYFKYYINTNLITFIETIYYTPIVNERNVFIDKIYFLYQNSYIFYSYYFEKINYFWVNIGFLKYSYFFNIRLIVFIVCITLTTIYLMGITVKLIYMYLFFFTLFFILPTTIIIYNTDCISKLAYLNFIIDTSFSNRNLYVDSNYFLTNDSMRGIEKFSDITSPWLVDFENSGWGGDFSIQSVSSQIIERERRVIMDNMFIDSSPNLKNLKKTPGSLKNRLDKLVKRLGIYFWYSFNYADDIENLNNSWKRQLFFTNNLNNYQDNNNWYASVFKFNTNQNFSIIGNPQMNRFSYDELMVTSIDSQLDDEFKTQSSVHIKTVTDDYFLSKKNNITNDVHRSGPAITDRKATVFRNVVNTVNTVKNNYNIKTKIPDTTKTANYIFERQLQESRILDYEIKSYLKKFLNNKYNFYFQNKNINEILTNYYQKTLNYNYYILKNNNNMKNSIIDVNFEENGIIMKSSIILPLKYKHNLSEERVENLLKLMNLELNVYDDRDFFDSEFPYFKNENREVLGFLDKFGFIPEVLISLLAENKLKLGAYAYADFEAKPWDYDHENISDVWRYYFFTYKIFLKHTSIHSNKNLYNFKNFIDFLRITKNKMPNIDKNYFFIKIINKMKLNWFYTEKLKSGWQTHTLFKYFKNENKLHNDLFVNRIYFKKYLNNISKNVHNLDYNNYYIADTSFDFKYNLKKSNILFYKKTFKKTLENNIAMPNRSLFYFYTIFRFITISNIFSQESMLNGILLNKDELLFGTLGDNYYTKYLFQFYIVKNLWIIPNYKKNQYLATNIIGFLINTINSIFKSTTRIYRVGYIKLKNSYYYLDKIVFYFNKFYNQNNKYIITHSYVKVFSANNYWWVYYRFSLCYLYIKVLFSIFLNYFEYYLYFIDNFSFNFLKIFNKSLKPNKNTNDTQYISYIWCNIFKSIQNIQIPNHQKFQKYGKLYSDKFLLIFLKNKNIGLLESFSNFFENFKINKKYILLFNKIIIKILNDGSLYDFNKLKYLFNKIKILYKNYCNLWILIYKSYFNSFYEIFQYIIIVLKKLLYYLNYTTIRILNFIFNFFNFYFIVYPYFANYFDFNFLILCFIKLSCILSFYENFFRYFCSVIVIYTNLMYKIINFSTFIFINKINYLLTFYSIQLENLVKYIKKNKFEDIKEYATIWCLKNTNFWYSNMFSKMLILENNYYSNITTDVLDKFKQKHSKLIKNILDFIIFLTKIYINSDILSKLNKILVLFISLHFKFTNIVFYYNYLLNSWLDLFSFTFIEGFILENIKTKLTKYFNLQKFSKKQIFKKYCLYFKNLENNSIVQSLLINIYLLNFFIVNSILCIVNLTNIYNDLYVIPKFILIIRYIQQVLSIGIKILNTESIKYIFIYFNKFWFEITLNFNSILKFELIFKIIDNVLLYIINPMNYISIDNYIKKLYIFIYKICKYFKLVKYLFIYLDKIYTNSLKFLFLYSNYLNNFFGYFYIYTLQYKDILSNIINKNKYKIYNKKYLYFLNIKNKQYFQKYDKYNPPYQKFNLKNKVNNFIQKLLINFIIFFKIINLNIKLISNLLIKKILELLGYFYSLILNFKKLKLINFLKLNYTKITIFINIQMRSFVLFRYNYLKIIILKIDALYKIFKYYNHLLFYIDIFISIKQISNIYFKLLVKFNNLSNNFIKLNLSNKILKNYLNTTDNTTISIIYLNIFIYKIYNKFFFIKYNIEYPLNLSLKSFKFERYVNIFSKILEIIIYLENKVLMNVFYIDNKKLKNYWNLKNNLFFIKNNKVTLNCLNWFFKITSNLESYLSNIYLYFRNIYFFNSNVKRFYRNIIKYILVEISKYFFQLNNYLNYIFYIAKIFIVNFNIYKKNIFIKIFINLKIQIIYINTITSFEFIYTLKILKEFIMNKIIKIFYFYLFLYFNYIYNTTFNIYKILVKLYFKFIVIIKIQNQIPYFYIVINIAIQVLYHISDNILNSYMLLWKYFLNFKYILKLYDYWILLSLIQIFICFLFNFFDPQHIFLYQNVNYYWKDLDLYKIVQQKNHIIGDIYQCKKIIKYFIIVKLNTMYYNNSFGMWLKFHKNYINFKTEYWCFIFNLKSLYYIMLTWVIHLYWVIIHIRSLYINSYTIYYTFYRIKMIFPIVSLYCIFILDTNLLDYYFRKLKSPFINNQLQKKISKTAILIKHTNNRQNFENFNINWKQINNFKFCWNFTNFKKIKNNLNKNLVFISIENLNFKKFSWFFTNTPTYTNYSNILIFKNLLKYKILLNLYFKISSSFSINNINNKSMFICYKKNYNLLKLGNLFSVYNYFYVFLKKNILIFEYRFNRKLRNLLDILKISDSYCIKKDFNKISILVFGKKYDKLFKNNLYYCRLLVFKRIKNKIFINKVLIKKTNFLDLFIIYFKNISNINNISIFIKKYELVFDFFKNKYINKNIIKINWEVFSLWNSLNNNPISKKANDLFKNIFNYNISYIRYSEIFYKKNSNTLLNINLKNNSIYKNVDLLFYKKFMLDFIDNSVTSSKIDYKIKSSNLNNNIGLYSENHNIGIFNRVGDAKKFKKIDNSFVKLDNLLFKDLTYRGAKNFNNTLSVALLFSIYKYLDTYNDKIKIVSNLLKPKPKTILYINEIGKLNNFGEYATIFSMWNIIYSYYFKLKEYLLYRINLKFPNPVVIKIDISLLIENFDYRWYDRLHKKIEYNIFTKKEDKVCKFGYFSDNRIYRWFLIKVLFMSPILFNFDGNGLFKNTKFSRYINKQLFAITITNYLVYIQNVWNYSYICNLNNICIYEYAYQSVNNYLLWLHLQLKLNILVINSNILIKWVNFVKYNAQAYLKMMIIVEIFSNINQLENNYINIYKYIEFIFFDLVTLELVMFEYKFFNSISNSELGYLKSRLSLNTSILLEYLSGSKSSDKKQSYYTQQNKYIIKNLNIFEIVNVELLHYFNKYIQLFELLLSWIFYSLRYEQHTQSSTFFIKYIEYFTELNEIIDEKVYTRLVYQIHNRLQSRWLKLTIVCDLIFEYLTETDYELEDNPFNLFLEEFINIIRTFLRGDPFYEIDVSNIDFNEWSGNRAASTENDNFHGFSDIDFEDSLSFLGWGFYKNIGENPGNEFSLLNDISEIPEFIEKVLLFDINDFYNNIFGLDDPQLGNLQPSFDVSLPLKSLWMVGVIYYSPEWGGVALVHPRSLFNFIKILYLDKRTYFSNLFFLYFNSLFVQDSTPGILFVKIKLIYFYLDILQVYDSVFFSIKDILHFWIFYLIYIIDFIGISTIISIYMFFILLLKLNNIFEKKERIENKNSYSLLSIFYNFWNYNIFRFFYLFISNIILFVKMSISLLVIFIISLIFTEGLHIFSILRLFDVSQESILQLNGQYFILERDPFVEKHNPIDEMPDSFNYESDIDDEWSRLHFNRENTEIFGGNGKENATVLDYVGFGKKFNIDFDLEDDAEEVDTTIALDSKDIPDQIHNSFPDENSYRPNFISDSELEREFFREQESYGEETEGSLDYQNRTDSRVQNIWFDFNFEDMHDDQNIQGSLDWDEEDEQLDTDLYAALLLNLGDHRWIYNYSESITARELNDQLIGSSQQHLYANNIDSQFHKIDKIETSEAANNRILNLIKRNKGKINYSPILDFYDEDSLVDWGLDINEEYGTSLGTLSNLIDVWDDHTADPITQLTKHSKNTSINDPIHFNFSSTDEQLPANYYAGERLIFENFFDTIFNTKLIGFKNKTTSTLFDDIYDYDEYFEDRADDSYDNFFPKVGRFSIMENNYKNKSFVRDKMPEAYFNLTSYVFKDLNNELSTKKNMKNTNLNAISLENIRKRTLARKNLKAENPVTIFYSEMSNKHLDKLISYSLRNANANWGPTSFFKNNEFSQKVDTSQKNPTWIAQQNENLIFYRRRYRKRNFDRGGFGYFENPTMFDIVSDSLELDDLDFERIKLEQAAFVTNEQSRLKNRKWKPGKDLLRNTPYIRTVIYKKLNPQTASIDKNFANITENSMVGITLDAQNKNIINFFEKLTPKEKPIFKLVSNKKKDGIVKMKEYLELVLNKKNNLVKTTMSDIFNIKVNKLSENNINKNIKIKDTINRYNFILIKLNEDKTTFNKKYNITPSPNKIKSLQTRYYLNKITNKYQNKNIVKINNLSYDNSEILSELSSTNEIYNKKLEQYLTIFENKKINDNYSNITENNNFRLKEFIFFNKKWITDQLGNLSYKIKTTAVEDTNLNLKLGKYKKNIKGFKKDISLLNKKITNARKGRLGSYKKNRGYWVGRKGGFSTDYRLTNFLKPKIIENPIFLNDSEALQEYSELWNTNFSRKNNNLDILGMGQMRELPNYRAYNLSTFKRKKNWNEKRIKEDRPIWIDGRSSHNPETDRFYKKEDWMHIIENLHEGDSLYGFKFDIGPNYGYYAHSSESGKIQKILNSSFFEKKLNWFNFNNYFLFNNKNIKPWGLNITNAVKWTGSKKWNQNIKEDFIKHLENGDFRVFQKNETNSIMLKKRKFKNFLNENFIKRGNGGIKQNVKLYMKSSNLVEKKNQIWIKEQMLPTLLVENELTPMNFLGIDVDHLSFNTKINTASNLNNIRKNKYNSATSRGYDFLLSHQDRIYNDELEVPTSISGLEDRITDNSMKFDHSTKFYQYGKTFKSIKQNAIMQDYFKSNMALDNIAVTPDQSSDYFWYTYKKQKNNKIENFFKKINYSRDIPSFNKIKNLNFENYIKSPTNSMEPYSYSMESYLGKSTENNIPNLSEYWDSNYLESKIYLNNINNPISIKDFEILNIEDINTYNIAENTWKKRNKKFEKFLAKQPEMLANTNFYEKKNKNSISLLFNTIEAGSYDIKNLNLWSKKPQNLKYKNKKLNKENFMFSNLFESFNHSSKKKRNVIFEQNEQLKQSQLTSITYNFSKEFGFFKNKMGIVKNYPNNNPLLKAIFDISKLKNNSILGESQLDSQEFNNNVDSDYFETQNNINIEDSGFNFNTQSSKFLDSPYLNKVKNKNFLKNTSFIFEDSEIENQLFQKYGVDNSLNLTTDYFNRNQTVFNYLLNKKYTNIGILSKNLKSKNYYKDNQPNTENILDFSDYDSLSAAFRLHADSTLQNFNKWDFNVNIVDSHMTNSFLIENIFNIPNNYNNSKYKLNNPDIQDIQSAKKLFVNYKENTEDNAFEEEQELSHNKEDSESWEDIGLDTIFYNNKKINTYQKMGLDYRSRGNVKPNSIASKTINIRPRLLNNLEYKNSVFSEFDEEFMNSEDSSVFQNYLYYDKFLKISKNNKKLTNIGKTDLSFKKKILKNPGIGNTVDTIYISKDRKVNTAGNYELSIKNMKNGIYNNLPLNNKNFINHNIHKIKPNTLSNNFNTYLKNKKTDTNLNYIMEIQELLNNSDITFKVNNKLNNKDITSLWKNKNKSITDELFTSLSLGSDTYKNTIKYLSKKNKNFVSAVNYIKNTIYLDSKLKTDYPYGSKRYNELETNNNHSTFKAKKSGILKKSKTPIINIYQIQKTKDNTIVTINNNITNKFKHIYGFYGNTFNHKIDSDLNYLNSVSIPISKNFLNYNKNTKNLEKYFIFNNSNKLPIFIENVDKNLRNNNTSDSYLKWDIGRKLGQIYKTNHTSVGDKEEKIATNFRNFSYSESIYPLPVIKSLSIDSNLFNKVNSLRIFGAGRLTDYFYNTKLKHLLNNDIKLINFNDIDGDIMYKDDQYLFEFDNIENEDFWLKDFDEKINKKKTNTYILKNNQISENTKLSNFSTNTIENFSDFKQRSKYLTNFKKFKYSPKFKIKDQGENYDILETVDESEQEISVEELELSKLPFNELYNSWDFKKFINTKNISKNFNTESIKSYLGEYALENKILSLDSDLEYNNYKLSLKSELNEKKIPIKKNIADFSLSNNYGGAFEDIIINLYSDILNQSDTESNFIDYEQTKINKLNNIFDNLENNEKIQDLGEFLNLQNMYSSSNIRQNLNTSLLNDSVNSYIVGKGSNLQNNHFNITDIDDLETKIIANFSQDDDFNDYSVFDDDDVEDISNFISERFIGLEVPADKFDYYSDSLWLNKGYFSQLSKNVLENRKNSIFKSFKLFLNKTKSSENKIFRKYFKDYKDRPTIMKLSLVRQNQEAQYINWFLNRTHWSNIMDEYSNITKRQKLTPYELNFEDEFTSFEKFRNANSLENNELLLGISDYLTDPTPDNLNYSDATLDKDTLYFNIENSLTNTNLLNSIFNNNETKSAWILNNKVVKTLWKNNLTKKYINLNSYANIHTNLKFKDDISRYVNHYFIKKNLLNLKNVTSNSINNIGNLVRKTNAHPSLTSNIRKFKKLKKKYWSRLDILEKYSNNLKNTILKAENSYKTSIVDNVKTIKNINNKKPIHTDISNFLINLEKNNNNFRLNTLNIDTNKFFITADLNNAETIQENSYKNSYFLNIKNNDFNVTPNKKYFNTFEDFWEKNYYDEIRENSLNNTANKRYKYSNFYSMFFKEMPQIVEIQNFLNEELPLSDNVSYLSYKLNNFKKAKIKDTTFDLKNNSIDNFLQDLDNDINEENSSYGLEDDDTFDIYSKVRNDLQKLEINKYGNSYLPLNFVSFFLNSIPNYSINSYISEVPKTVNFFKNTNHNFINSNSNNLFNSYENFIQKESKKSYSRLNSISYFKKLPTIDQFGIYHKKITRPGLDLSNNYSTIPIDPFRKFKQNSELYDRSVKYGTGEYIFKNSPINRRSYDLAMRTLGPDIITNSTLLGYGRFDFISDPNQDEDEDSGTNSGLGYPVISEQNLYNYDVTDVIETYASPSIYSLNFLDFIWASTNNNTYRYSKHRKEDPYYRNTEDDLSNSGYFQATGRYQTLPLFSIFLPKKKDTMPFKFRWNSFSTAMNEFWGLKFVKDFSGYDTHSWRTLYNFLMIDNTNPPDYRFDTYRKGILFPKPGTADALSLRKIKDEGGFYKNGAQNYIISSEADSDLFRSGYTENIAFESYIGSHINDKLKIINTNEEKGTERVGSSYLVDPEIPLNFFGRGTVRATLLDQFRYYSSPPKKSLDYSALPKGSIEPAFNSRYFQTWNTSRELYFERMPVWEDIPDSDWDLQQYDFRTTHEYTEEERKGKKPRSYFYPKSSRTPYDIISKLKLETEWDWKTNHARKNFNKINNFLTKDKKTTIKLYDDLRGHNIGPLGFEEGDTIYENRLLNRGWYPEKIVWNWGLRDQSKIGNDLSTLELLSDYAKSFQHNWSNFGHFPKTEALLSTSWAGKNNRLFNAIDDVVEGLGIEEDIPLSPYKARKLWEYEDYYERYVYDDANEDHISVFDEDIENVFFNKGYSDPDFFYHYKDDLFNTLGFIKYEAESNSWADSKYFGNLDATHISGSSLALANNVLYDGVMTDFSNYIYEKFPVHPINNIKGKILPLTTEGLFTFGDFQDSAIPGFGDYINDYEEDIEDDEDWNNEEDDIEKEANFNLLETFKAKDSFSFSPADYGFLTIEPEWVIDGEGWLGNTGATLNIFDYQNVNNFYLNPESDKFSIPKGIHSFEILDDEDEFLGLDSPYFSLSDFKKNRIVRGKDNDISNFPIKSGWNLPTGFTPEWHNLFWKHRMNFGDSSESTWFDVDEFEYQITNSEAPSKTGLGIPLTDTLLDNPDYLVFTEIELNNRNLWWKAVSGGYLSTEAKNKLNISNINNSNESYRDFLLSYDYRIFGKSWINPQNSNLPLKSFSFYGDTQINSWLANNDSYSDINIDNSGNNFSIFDYTYGHFVNSQTNFDVNMSYYSINIRNFLYKFFHIFMIYFSYSFNSIFGLFKFFFNNLFNFLFYKLELLSILLSIKHLKGNFSSIFIAISNSIIFIHLNLLIIERLLYSLTFILINDFNYIIKQICIIILENLNILIFYKNYLNFSKYIVIGFFYYILFLLFILL